MWQGRAGRSREGWRDGWRGARQGGRRRPGRDHIYSQQPNPGMPQRGPSPSLTCAMAWFLSSVAFMSPTSSAATLSCSSLTLALMPASFLLAASSFLLASASAARLGATTCRIGKHGVGWCCVTAGVRRLGAVTLGRSSCAKLQVCRACDRGVDEIGCARMQGKIHSHTCCS